MRKVVCQLRDGDVVQLDGKRRHVIAIGDNDRATKVVYLDKDYQVVLPKFETVRVL